MRDTLELNSAHCVSLYLKYNVHYPQLYLYLSSVEFSAVKCTVSPIIRYF